MRPILPRGGFQANFRSSSVRLSTNRVRTFHNFWPSGRHRTSFSTLRSCRACVGSTNHQLSTSSHSSCFDAHKKSMAGHRSSLRAAVSAKKEGSGFLAHRSVILEFVPREELSGRGSRAAARLSSQWRCAGEGTCCAAMRTPRHPSIHPRSQKIAERNLI